MFANFSFTLTIADADKALAFERFLAASPIPASLIGSITTEQWIEMVAKDTANGILKAGAKVIFDAAVQAEVDILNSEWVTPPNVII